jgi:hypothetical protein
MGASFLSQIQFKILRERWLYERLFRVFKRDAN